MSKIIRLADLEEKPAQDPVEQFALDVLMGLTSSPKLIPPKYLYDKRGSELFQNITDTTDYYPTRCEAEILTNYSNEIAGMLGNQPLNIVELGAGDGRKTKILLKSLLNSDLQIRYCPIDISEDAILGLVESLKGEFPNLETLGIVSEYFEALRWLRDAGDRRNLVLFLGSNIGNFNRPQSQVFMKTMWNSLSNDDFVLLGCDLKKNVDTMLRAYNDSEGVTRSFNLNLLDRMNSELGANFDVSKFDHFGTYNVQLGAMESFLLSTEHQVVNIDSLNKGFRFQPYEPIHVEFSFKYLPQDINELAFDSGYRVIERFTDKNEYFTDVILQVQKSLVT